jgi:hypothetical protein
MKTNSSLINVIFVSIFILLVQNSFANDSIQNKTDVKYPGVFVGLSAGINHHAGLLGLSLDVNVVKNLSLFGGVGVGGWGYKTSVGLKYYKQYPYGVSYFGGLSHASGMKDFETELETSSGSKEKVKLDLFGINNLNLGMGYVWKVGNNMRFGLDFGYSICLSQKKYEVKSGQTLSSNAEKVMDILVPGGLILGLAFNFGIN